MGRRAAAEVPLVHERGANPPERRVARDPRPRDPTADDEEIHGLRRHGCERRGARLMREGRLGGQLPSTHVAW